VNSDTRNLTEDTTKYVAEIIPESFPCINCILTATNEIKNFINSLKSKNVCGYDEISTK
jgi:hypothetical protein